MPPGSWFARTPLHMKRILGILSLALIGGCAYWGVKTSRANTETAPYKSVRKEGDFEIRDYPDLKLASTSMAGADENGGFMRLFRYITGANERSEAISMTTPVLIDRSAGGTGMSFVVPTATVEKGVPAPKSKAVQVKELQAARYAVLRFPGGNKRPNEEAALAKLKGWCARQKLTTQGEPLFAYYDPPWTPSFLRRNEVLIRVGQ